MWQNIPLVVYHGTDEHSALQIMTTTIDPRIGKDPSDFGRGFYVTSILASARYWANQKVRRLTQPCKPAVLTFNISRDMLGELDDHLAFGYPTDMFFDFVIHNRANGGGEPNHARSGRDPRSGAALSPYYDLVYGPVSMYPHRRIRYNADQICFLTRKAADCLGKPVGDPDLGDPFLRVRDA
jgi:hypothetical protein